MSKPSTKQSSLTEEQRAVIPFVQSCKQSVTVIVFAYVLVGMYFVLDGLQEDYALASIVVYWTGSREVMTWVSMTNEVPHEYKFIFGGFLLALAAYGTCFRTLVSSQLRKQTLKYFTIWYIWTSVVVGVLLVFVGLLNLMILALEMLNVVELRNKNPVLPVPVYVRLYCHVIVTVAGGIMILLRLVSLRIATFYLTELESRSAEPIMYPSIPAHSCGNPFADEPSNPFAEVAPNPFEDDEPVEVQPGFLSQDPYRVPQDRQLAKIQPDPSHGRFNYPELPVALQTQIAYSHQTNPFLDETVPMMAIRPAATVVLPQPSRCVWASLV